MKQLSGSKIKLLATSIIVLFILQEVLIYNYISEPYPALRMPSFYGNGINSEGFYEIRSIDIEIDFGDGDYLMLTPRNFFFNAPSSHHWALVSKFQPTNEIEGIRPYERLEFLKPILPGFFISRNRSYYEIQNNPETLQWLRKHIAEISPDKNPKKISFSWYKNEYDPKDLSNSNRELTGTTTLSLYHE